MPEFNLDQFKKTWQEQNVKAKYGNSDILEMLNRKSRNYVKYILWISVAEFLFFLALTVFYTILPEDSDNFLTVTERLGVKRTPEVEHDFSVLYMILKILSLCVTAFFVIRFYTTYRKIHVESNIRKFILQIINYRKTVNYFILSNLLLLVISTMALTLFIFRKLSIQQVVLEPSTLWGFLLGITLSLLLSTALIWLYYRLVYGIISRRLGKTLIQLQEAENDRENGESDNI